MLGKIGIVTRNEYQRAVASKAFLVGIILMPVLFGGSLIAMAIAETAPDTAERRFAVLDRTGVLWPVVQAACERRNAEDLFESPAPQDREGAAPGDQVRPRWLPELHEPGPDPQGDDLALSARVRNGELLGYVVLGADLLAAEEQDERAGDGAPADRTFAWHTNTPTYDDLPAWLGSVLANELRGRRLAQAGLDADQVLRLTRWERLQTLGLSQMDAEGRVTASREKDLIARVIIPAALAMFLFMLVMMSTPALMNNVLEEKMQRIAEVLVSSVSPFELLAGKLLSAVLVSLTLSVLYVGATLVLVHTVEQVPPEIAASLTPATLGWFLFFLVMALLIFGSIFGALGAACSELQDAQTLMGPAMLIILFPLFFLGPIIKNPDGAMAMALSFFPPATPMLMMLRINMPPGVAWWEIVLAVVITVLFAVGCVAAGGKIFRIGILSQGQAPSWRRLAAWLMSG